MRVIRMKSIIPITFLCTLPIVSLQAAEWSISGSLNPFLEYDDNIFMRDTNKVGDYHSSVTPTLVTSYALDQTNVSLSVGYAIDRYEASKYLDNETPFFRFNSSHQTERSKWGLGLSYVKSASRSEAEIDTGDFETDSTSTTRSITPSFVYQLTERDSLSFRGGYSKKEFSTLDFSDTETKYISTGWQHQFTERLNGGLDLTANNSKSSSLTTATDNDSYDLSLVSTYNLSEIWALKGKVGFRLVEDKQTNDTDSGSSLDINVSYKFDIDTANLSISRSLFASDNGGVNERDQINATFSRQLSETLIARVSSTYQEIRSASGGNSNDIRKNFSVSPSISWNFSSNVNLGLSYKYRHQKDSQVGTDVDSNAIMLTLNYDWDGLQISR